MTDLPICPVCHGRKVRYHSDSATWGPDPCCACGGSGIGPKGCMTSDEHKARQRAGLARAAGKPAPDPAPAPPHRGRGHAPQFSKDELRYLRNADAGWTATPEAAARHRRPQGWYADLAVRFNRTFANRLRPPRTVSALRQRIWMIRHGRTSTHGKA